MFQRFDILKWKGTPPSIQRVVWIDAVTQQIATINIEESGKLITMAVPQWQSLHDLVQAVENGQVAIIDDTYSLHIRNDDNLTKGHAIHILNRDKHWAIISSMLYTDDHEFRVEILDPTVRGVLIRNALSENPFISEPWLRTLLTRCFQGRCSPNDVLPRYLNSGAPGKTRSSKGRKLGRPNARTSIIGENGVNLSPADIDNMKRAFRMYELGQCDSLVSAHQWMLERYYNIGYKAENGVSVPLLPPSDEMPSIETFTKTYQKLADVVRATIGRLGQHAYDTKLRPNYGQGRNKLRGSGEVYVDATVPDVWLVSEKDLLLIIGRPVLTIAVTEDYLFAGFSVLLEGPSYIGSMVLLDCMNRDKVELCAEYGIIIDEAEWPWQGVADVVYSDRAELLSKDGDRWVTDPNIAQGTAAPFRPDWKWSVEGSFNLLEHAGINDVPGTPDARLFRQGTKYIFDACLTVHGFVQL
ncbi:MAG: hypothetical protein HGA87_04800 [Desulfobulbaceae bacterium]|nr:hypothetical protein [Desulfobulbaceae bacterium]